MSLTADLVGGVATSHRANSRRANTSFWASHGLIGWYTFTIGQGKENVQTFVSYTYTCPFVDIANKVRTYDVLNIGEASQFSFELFRLFIYL